MKRSQQGMTLIELLVTIALAGVLVAAGVPSLQRFLQSSRMTSQANEINAFLSLARTEALQRFDNAIVEPSGGSWTDGEWVLGIDENGDGSVTGDEILHRMAAIDAGTFTMVDDDGNAVAQLAFDPRGWPATEATITYQAASCLDNNRRVVRLRPTGNIRVDKADCQ